LLIDGGNANRAGYVHRYVKANIFGSKALDRILVTHYDKDHSGGIVELLNADNRYRLLNIIADEAGRVVPATNDERHRIAAATGAAIAAMAGCYNGSAYRSGANYSFLAEDIGKQAARALPGDKPSGSIAKWAADWVESACYVDMSGVNDSLVAKKSTRARLAREAGKAAGTTRGGETERTAAAYRALEAAVLAGVSANSCFMTDGLYADTRLFDVGELTDVGLEVARSKDAYGRAVEGKLLLNSDMNVTVPGLKRPRTTPTLSQEILWGDDPPEGAPLAYVVAINGAVRNGTRSRAFQGGEAENKASIALIIRFNNFFFYTGGDLPWQGEDFIPADVKANGLPDPWHAGQSFAVPDHICAFKCGHHGSQTSSSEAFVTGLGASAALISAGESGNEHPDQVVVDRLFGNPQIQNFYFTNLFYQTNHVPASQGESQLSPPPGAKGRIAGDNKKDANHVRRGDVVLKVTQKRSESTTHPPMMLDDDGVHHGFTVEYWDDGDGNDRGQLLCVAHPH
jgi:hypothetical protein